MRTFDSASMGTLFLAALAIVWLAGCGHKDCDSCHSTRAQDGAVQGDTKKESEEEMEIRANRAQLNAEDRQLVDVQDFCVVMEDSRLGSMGAPIKVVLKDKDGKEQAVFVCCKGCVKKAQRDPEQTLAKVAQLKAKSRAPTSKQ